MSLLVENKVAVVTGSSAGIGAGIAAVLAREGADVVVNYRSNDEGAQATATTVRDEGRKAEIVQADVSVAADVDRLIETAMQRFGRIDILVNNAGITTRKAFLASDERFFDEMMGTDLKGVYLCARRAAPIMVKQKQGRIINISSIHDRMTSHDFALYAAAKGGVKQLTQGMAVELGDHGITVNAISPGWVPVPNEGECPKPIYEEFCNRMPIPRPGKTEEVGDLAAFLASDRAAWITAQVIYIDGGLSCTINMPSRVRDKQLYGLD